MKAEELRIGNYIDVKSVVYKVVGIDLEGVMTEPLPNPERIIDMDRNDTTHPIPLTEEWLVKFGFEKSRPNYTWYQLKNITINVFNGEVYRLNINGYNHFSAFKHVHQLQNLYFALTGEELTIKE